MKKCKKAKRRLISLAIVGAIIALIFSYFQFYVNPQIVKTHSAQIKSNVISIINSAIDKTIAQNDYDDLIEVSKDINGDIVLLHVNSKNANKLNNNISEEVQTSLDDGSLLSYSLPLGAFLGIPLLSHVGPQVQLQISQIGHVQTKFRSQIASLSINQSYHKIYITIKTVVCVVLPLYTQNIEVSNQVLIAENILVGKIPDTYLNTDNLTNALNLIP